MDATSILRTIPVNISFVLYRSAYLGRLWIGSIPSFLKIFHLVNLIGNLLIRMSFLQLPHSIPRILLIRTQNLNFIFLYNLLLSNLSNCRIGPLHRRKLSLTSHLKGTIPVIPNAPCTSGKDGSLDCDCMSNRNIESELVSSHFCNADVGTVGEFTVKAEAGQLQPKSIRPWAVRAPSVVTGKCDSINNHS